MAKKTYRTHHLKGLQILLFDDYGRPMEVNFRSGAQIDSTAKFTTSDERMQKALESCSGFGRDFYVESTREDKPAVNENQNENKKGKANENVAAEEPANESTVQTVKVADKSEAIEWLKENYPDRGYTAVKLRSTAAFEAACKECGVNFEF